MVPFVVHSNHVQPQSTFRYLDWITVTVAGAGRPVSPSFFRTETDRMGTDRTGTDRTGNDRMVWRRVCLHAPHPPRPSESCANA